MQDRLKTALAGRYAVGREIGAGGMATVFFDGGSLVKTHPLATLWTVTALLLLSPAAAFSQNLSYHLLDVESVGIPALDYAPLEGLGINDLKLWNGRIYIGHGEGTINTGPTEILYFDLSENRVFNEFLTDENSIGLFRVLNGQLAIPGQDRVAGPSGAIYVLSEDGWTKHNSVPGTSHVLDAAVFQGRWYVSTGGTRFRVDDSSAYWGNRIGTVMESRDRGKSFTLSYSTPSDASDPGNLRQFRIGSLAAFAGKLYAFPFLMDMLTAEEIPERFRGALGDVSRLPIRYRAGGRYIMQPSDPFGRLDALVYDGKRWDLVDLVPEGNVSGISGHVFKDQLLLTVLTGRYLHYSRLKTDFPAQASTKLYVFDGTQSRVVPYGGDNIRDVLVRNDRLYLLIWKDDLRMIAETDDLERWTYHVLPGMLENPRALEFDGESFYISMVDGNLFRSVGEKSLTSFKDAQRAAPRSYHGVARIPREGHWYWSAITDWRDWGIPTRIHVHFRSQDRVEVTLDNVAGFLIFLPAGWIDSTDPVGIFVNGQPVFQGTIGGASALRATLEEDGEWRVEPTNLTAETYRPPDKVLGVVETTITMEGELPTGSRWKAEVYRRATGADIGFAHQWPPGVELAPGEIRLGDLLDEIGRDSVFVFRLTGQELRRMIEFNIRHDRQLRVALAGVPATFELHDDASNNRVIEWGLEDDSTYIVAGDLHEPGSLSTWFGFNPEWTPAGLTAFQAAIRWFETHHQVRDTPSQIRIVRRR